MTKDISSGSRRCFALFLLLGTWLGSAQQDPQFTQYMYNPMGVNPAYAGTQGELAALLMHRSQWVGINGAPSTQILAIDAPLRDKVGLGGVLTHDVLGPASEIALDANVSYTIQLDSMGNKLSFGLRVGARLFDVDFTKGLMENPDMAFQDNIESKFFPGMGAGVYYHSAKGYIGFSVPNFFSQKHYDGQQHMIAAERMHYYLFGGRNFELGPVVVLRPGIFVKWVPGAPMIADFSVTALLKETFTVGLAYRWDDSFAVLLGLRISNALGAGYAYDLTSSNLGSYTGGSHEIFLKYSFGPSRKGPADITKL